MDGPVARIIKIFLMFVAIVLLILFVVWIFRPDSEPTEQTTTEPVAPEQYSTVKFVQDGEITAPENHYSVSIIITNTTRRIEVYRGYDVGPKKSDSFTNNTASYDALYAALKASGFFDKKDATVDNKDGYCPLGVRYQYLAGQDIATPNYETWGASCSKKAGSFNGNASTVKKLFINQIPEYSEFMKGVTL